MFLTYRFNSFDFVNTTILSNSSAILLIALLAAFFFSRSFDMCKFISSKNLKRLKLGSLGLHQKVLKLCFLNISSLSCSSSVS